MKTKRRRIVSDDESNSSSISSIKNNCLDLACIPPSRFKQLDTPCHDVSKNNVAATPTAATMVVEVPLYDIPDGPFLLILSYISKRRRSNGSNNSSNRDHHEDVWDQAMFALSTLACTCKAMRERMLGVVQNLPLHLDISSLPTSTHSTPADETNVIHDKIRTVCQYHMKLQSLSFRFDDQVYKSIFTHILNCCDISSMASLSFHLNPTHCNLDLLDICDAMGVPCDRMHRAILLCNLAFQKNVALILERQQCQLQCLHVRFKIEERLEESLFCNSAVTRSLERLELEGWCSMPSPDSYFTARSLSCLRETLGRLHRLKFLILRWPRLRRDVLSDLTLTGLEMLHLEGGLSIERLHCPCLKKMILVLNTYRMDLSLLHQCQCTLEDLTLAIHHNHTVVDETFMHDLARALENLAVIKRLKLVTEAQCRLHIRSLCLKELDICDAPHVTVQSCKCPNLVKISCTTGPHAVMVQFNSRMQLYYSMPFVPLNGMFRIVSGVADFLGGISFTIGNSRFVGMEVPSTCMIELTEVK